MPTYCFTNQKTGQTVERIYRVGKAPNRIRMADGTFVRDMAAEHRTFRHQPGNWPLLSDALGVAHDQTTQAAKAMADAGVPTDFAPDGRCILRSPEHRRQVCQVLGYYDRNAGYSDPVPTQR